MTKAANIQPLSPAASPKLTASQIIPGLNIKINDGTQPAPVDLDLPLLQTWENRYNRYNFPVMSTSDFQNVVPHVMQDPTMSDAHESALEKEVAKRLQSAKNEHEEDLKKLRNEILMDEDIPNDLDELIAYLWVDDQHATTQYMVQSYPQGHTSTNDRCTEDLRDEDESSNTITPQSSDSKQGHFIKEGAAELYGISLALQIVQDYADRNGSRCNVAVYTNNQTAIWSVTKAEGRTGAYILEEIAYQIQDLQQHAPSA
ncbi:hypothetical protein PMIN06_012556 [Paraphaeosphaeria minitans]